MAVVPYRDPLDPHVERARKDHASLRRDGGVHVPEELEPGRRMAAEALRLDPEQRKMVESVYGLTYCKARWPEAYVKESA